MTPQLLVLGSQIKLVLSPACTAVVPSFGAETKPGRPWEAQGGLCPSHRPWVEITKASTPQCPARPRVASFTPTATSMMVPPLTWGWGCWGCYGMLLKRDTNGCTSPKHPAEASDFGALIYHSSRFVQGVPLDPTPRT